MQSACLHVVLHQHAINAISQELSHHPTFKQLCVSLNTSDGLLAVEIEGVIIVECSCDVRGNVLRLHWDTRNDELLDVLEMIRRGAKRTMCYRDDESGVSVAVCFRTE